MRRRRNFAILFGTLLAGPAIGIAFLRREPSFLDRAIPVSSALEWTARYRNSLHEDAYHWVSPQEILYFCDREGQLQAFRQKILPDGRSFPPSPGARVPTYGQIDSLSPDGRWLLQTARSS